MSIDIERGVPLHPRTRTSTAVLRTLCKADGDEDDAPEVGVARAPKTDCAAALPTVVDGGRRFLLLFGRVRG